MNEIFSLVAQNTVMGLVLALLVYGLTRVWRNPPAAHLLWLLVLVKLVAPPIVHVEWSAFGLPGSPRMRGDEITDVSPTEGRKVERPPAFDSPTAQRTAKASAAGATKPDFAAGLWRLWDRGRPVLLWLWLAGAALCALVCATRIARFQRLLRDTLPASTRLQRLAFEVARKLDIRRMPDVRYVDCVDVPMVWCAGRRPTIVLPMQLTGQFDDQQVGMILTHELAHVRRRDHWVRGVELIVSVIYWWNPMVWAVRRQIHHAEDLCCDAWVRHAFPDCTKRYAEVVLKATESFIASKRGARLLPASSFLHSLSLKARIQMILYSRFAPSVSARSMFVIALLALLVLPSFVQTRADTAAGSKAEATATPAAKPIAAATSEFPFAVKFEQGATRFMKGDTITIVEVRGTAGTFTPGNIYWIKGTYTLASHDRATLATYTTAMNAADATSTPLKVQMTEVARGNGTFTLFLPMRCLGWPHVSFYPAGGGEGFGGNYFGTGDSVLRQWWGETTARTPASLKGPGHTTFIVGHLDRVGWEMLRKQSPYSHQNMYGRWPITDEFKKALTKDAKPGDTVLLLLSLDDPGRAPKEFSDLLPLPWSEIESLLKQNQTVFRQGKARDMDVLLLATPTAESLRNEFRRLVGEGKFALDKGATTK